MNKLFCFALVTCLLLSGCSGVSKNESTTEPPDLTGTWKQTNSNSKTSYQEAVIQDDSIEVYWVNDEASTRALYWAGTFTAPTSSDAEYSWDSANDKEKTKTALLASGDDAKTFTYKSGELSYSVSAMGMTQTVKLEKQ